LKKQLQHLNDSWVGTSKTITINASDEGGSGLADEPYSFDGGNTWTSSNSMVFDEHTTVTIVVRDKAGNKTSKSETILIDKEMPSLSVIRAHGDVIIFEGGYTSSITINYSDIGGSGIAIAKYAKGEYDKNYFVTNGIVIANGGVIPNVKANEKYTIYVRDNAGNEKTITVHSNIYGYGATADLGNVKIKVGSKYVSWLVNYRDLTVTTSNGVTLTHYGKVARQTGYRDLDYLIGSGEIGSINTTNLFKQIKRDDNQYHSVYLKDSNGKEYLVWIEITDIWSD